MKRHLVALRTPVLVPIALALGVLQAVVALHGAVRPEPFVAPRAQSNRFSAPGGRAGVPWAPFDNKTQPANREGRTPQQKEEHRSPPPSPGRGFPAQPGPRAPRKLSA